VQGNLKLCPEVKLCITKDLEVHLREDGKTRWEPQGAQSTGLCKAIEYVTGRILCLDRKSPNSADGPKVGRSSDCLPMKTLAAYTHHQEGLGGDGDDETLYDTE